MEVRFATDVTRGSSCSPILEAPKYYVENYENIISTGFLQIIVHFLLFIVYINVDAFIFYNCASKSDCDVQSQSW